MDSFFEVVWGCFAGNFDAGATSYFRLQKSIYISWFLGALWSLLARVTNMYEVYV
jgi:hypothetical protein